MQKTLSVISLSSIVFNARLVRKLIGARKFYAVVKADGYGHGAVEAAKALEGVADGFCVALAEEGAQLRVGGVTLPVLVLAPPLDCDDAAKMKFYGLTPTVTDERSARLVKGEKCQLAVNSGMNRYGCCGKELLRTLEILPQGSLEGVYSHLYAAESESESAAQLESFLNEAAAVKKHSPDAFLHIAASGGILRGGKYLLDGVRCGIMLYGYAPCGFLNGALREELSESARETVDGLKPALKVYARLARETAVCGRGVGYNIADEKYDKLYTYRLGYADGFLRGVPLGEKTLCMDAFVSKLYKPLMPVMTDADEYAKRCKTISYEVLCSVTRRSERVYID